LSQSILTPPRVYFAMAEDGVFFHGVAPGPTRARALPGVAIVLQGAARSRCSRRADLSDPAQVRGDRLIFFALTASCLFVFRRRGERSRCPPPVSTLLFIGNLRGSGDRDFVHEPMHSLSASGDVGRAPSTCSGGGTDEAPAALCMLTAPALGQERRDPRVEASCSRIDPARLQSTVQRLVGSAHGTTLSGTQGAGPGIVPAREWLASELAALGKGSR